MANLEFYQDALGLESEEEIFSYIIETLKETIKGWDYFVDWVKVTSKVNNIERPLNLMNSLIGKTDIKKQFKDLLTSYPEVATVIPILVACREKDFTVLEIFNGDHQYKHFTFMKKNKLEEEEANRITEFVDNIGILDLFRNRQIKNIVDYVLGVEVGLDTNARKNRSGTIMESIVEKTIVDMCERNGWHYVYQATANKIEKELGHKIQTDKTSRAFDFAIRKEQQLFLVEVNYYGGSGSKLKATAGEYKAVYDYVRASSANKHNFIWITDGRGWAVTQNALMETFSHIDYILNLEMVSQGLLERVISMSPMERIYDRVAENNNNDSKYTRQK